MCIRRARAPARESGSGAPAGADPLERAGLDTPLRGYSTSMWWLPLGCSTTVGAATPPVTTMLIE